MRTINENTATKTSRAAVRPEHNRIWILVFIFSFLGLMIDGADLMLLSYSLTSIKAEFGLTSVEAGSLAASRWPAWRSAASMADGPATVSAA